MRALVINQQGSPVSPNVSLTTDFPDTPEPGPGQVRVRTLASALNHLDLWVGRGVPGLNLEYPRVAGCDACGEVEAVGPGVDPAWISKRVIVNAAIDTATPSRPGDPPQSSLAPNYELIGEHHSPGMHAESFLCPASNVAEIGQDADPTLAAAFGLATLTAYSMMVGKAGLKPGQSVLITGIGGGVALAALQLCVHLGCPAIVTSRHQWKLDKALELGAAHAVLDEGKPGKEGDWSRQVRGFTDKRGVDLAVDSVGKATHLSCIKSLARGGAYVTPGCTTGPDATTDLARIFWNQLRILGSTMGSNAEFGEVAALFRAGRLGAVVDGVYAPEQGHDAYARLESGEQFGKVVVQW
ncbi:MAG: NADPH:quinone reductase-like Zn-dependent oxidoreductase [Phycisphaerales bacterium]|jgi:NADPH:quinone reductase-like Zn-dependent oxidoreductase